MATYDKMTSLKNPGRSVQVESAIRDGSGKNIENNYAKQNGYYSTLKTGNADLADFADNLTPYGPNSGVEDDTPFIFKSAGGKSDIGSSAQIKGIYGVSKAWNQLAIKPTLTSRTVNGVIYVNNGDGSITISTDENGATADTTFDLCGNLSRPQIKQNDYVLMTNFANPHYNTYYLYDAYDENATNAMFNTGYGYIKQKSSNNQTLSPRIAIKSGTVISTPQTVYIQYFDLTLIFGAGNEPTTVDEFKALFPLDYYAYDAGSIVSSKVKGYKVVGYNAFDGELEVGSYNSAGQVQGGTRAFRSNKNTPIKVIAGEKYTFEITNAGSNSISSYHLFEYDINGNFIQRDVVYANNTQFTLTNNTQYIKFACFTGSADASLTGVQIAFHLTWDESKTGYEPYWSETYDFPNVELRGVNDIKDELLPDGTLTRRIGIVDLGTLTWYYVSNETRFYSPAITNLIKKSEGVAIVPNLLCSKYQVNKPYDIYNESKDKVISVDSDGNVLIRDTAYTGDVALKEALSGVYLIYELATPTTESVTPYTENTLIDDWGTQEWLSDNVVMLPQPADFFYSVDYKAFIDSLGGREDIDYTAENIVSQEQLSKVVEGTRPVTLALASDNLTPYSEESGATETNPFVFQSAGGGADIGSQAYLKGLRGNSVAFNQLIQNGNFESNNGWGVNSGAGDFSTLSVSNGILTQTFNSTPDTYYKSGILTTYGYRPDIIEGHYYLVKLNFRATKSCSIQAYTAETGYFESKLVNANTWFNYCTIKKATSTQLATTFSTNITNATILGNGDTLEWKEVQLIDLTQMFGAGNEPTTALEFNRLFPNTYYEYNVGELKSCKVSKVVNVGYNQFNKSDVSLRYNSVYIDSSGYINVGGTNYSLVLPIIAGQKYTVERKTKISARFRIATCPNIPTELYRAPHSAMDNDALSLTVQSGAEDRYLVINLSTNETEFLNQLENLCVHLTWDNSRTGYESYEKHEYNLPNVELKSAGSVYDELLPDGTLTRRVGVVDLGTLNWYNADSHTGRWETTGLRGLVKVPASATTKAKILCGKYETKTSTQVYNDNLGVSIVSDGNVRIFDTAYTDAAAFKTAMSGVYLFYELAEYVETQDDDYKYQEVQDIDDFGTQEFLYDNDIDIPVPQGNEFFYPVDYKAFIDSLGGRDDIEYAADKVVSQTQLTQALSTFLSSIQGYDATKTQTLKNVNGVFQWVDD